MNSTPVKELIADLYIQGIHLWLENGRLKAGADPNIMTDEIKAILVKRGNEIAEEIKNFSIDGEFYPMPFLDKNNDLRIPTQAHSKYKWWWDGQTIKATLEEIKNKTLN